MEPASGSGLSVELRIDPSPGEHDAKGGDRKSAEKETFKTPDGRVIERDKIPQSHFSKVCSFGYKLLEAAAITTASWNQRRLEDQQADFIARTGLNSIHELDQQDVAWWVCDPFLRAISDFMALQFVAMTHVGARWAAPQLQAKLNDAIYNLTERIWPGEGTRYFLKNPGNGCYQDYVNQAMPLLFGLGVAGYAAGAIAGEGGPATDQKAGDLGPSGLYRVDPYSTALWGTLTGLSVSLYAFIQTQCKEGVTWVDPKSPPDLAALRTMLQHARRAAYRAQGPFVISMAHGCMGTGLEAWRYFSHGADKEWRAAVSAALNFVIHYNRVDNYFIGLREEAFSEAEWRNFIGRAAPGSADHAHRIDLHETAQALQIALRNKQRPGVDLMNVVLHYALVFGMGAAWGGLVHHVAHGFGSVPMIPDRQDTWAALIMSPGSGDYDISPLDGSVSFAAGEIMGVCAHQGAIYLADRWGAPLPQRPRADGQQEEEGLQGDRKGLGADDKKDVEAAFHGESPAEREARHKEREHRAGLSGWAMGAGSLPVYALFGVPGLAGMALGGQIVNGQGRQFVRDVLINPTARFVSHARNLLCGSRPERVRERPEGAVELARSVVKLPVPGSQEAEASLSSISPDADNKAGPRGAAPEAVWPPEHGPLDKRLKFLPAPQFELEGIDCVLTHVDEEGMAHVIARHPSNPLQVAFIADLGGPQGARATSKPRGVGDQVEFTVTVKSLDETWQEELASRARS